MNLSGYVRRQYFFESLHALDRNDRLEKMNLSGYVRKHSMSPQRREPRPTL